MLVVFLDTETTGLNPNKHRTLELAFKITDLTAKKMVVSYDTVVAQPKEVWEEADPNSLKINSFTYEKTLKGKSEKTVEAEVIEIFNQSHVKRHHAVFVCQNPSFDRAFFSQIINPDLQEHYQWPYHWLDLASMYFAIRVQKDPKALEKIGELGLSKDQIAKYYDLPKETRPHRAMNGVEHLIACYQRVLSL